MGNSSNHGDLSRGASEAEPQWPRDFDFREAYAEQRELLDAGHGCLAGMPPRGIPNDESLCGIPASLIRRFAPP